jgi:sugar-specific transcriptional regulator TrmB
MAQSPVVSGLISKRAEIAGLIAHHRKEIARLSEEAQALDTAIKLFEPTYHARSVKPRQYKKKNVFFKHGEAHRMILEVLREAEQEMTTHGIAQAVMLRKDIEGEHEKAVQACLLTILHRQKKDGLVDPVGKDFRGNCLWKLAL